MNGVAQCPHERVVPEICDQTLGVSCLDCRSLVAVCWADTHIPESLWNRACVGQNSAHPCDQNRDDYCALCGVQCTAHAKAER